MFQITLKMAREMSGYTVEEVAEFCGVTTDCYREYEADFGKAPAGIAYAIHSLLKVSLDSIIM